MNTQLSLFELLEQKTEPENTNKCRHCKHIYEHFYNRSMKYCSQQKGKNTAYGNKKVKAMQPACNLFVSAL